MESPGEKDSRGGDAKPWSQQFGPFLTIGIQLALTVGAVTFIGWLIDRWLNTAPWCMVGGVILGATGGIISFVRTVMKLAKEQDEEVAEERRHREEKRET
jgi:F0F1-type ATP synthase assembly protein I